MMSRKRLHKMERTLETSEQTIKRRAHKVATSRKAMLIAMGIGCLTTAIISLLAFYHVSKWYDDNQVVFQYPKISVTVTYPIVIRERTPLATESAQITKVIQPTEEKPKVEVYAINNHVNYANLELVRKSKYPELFNHVWIRESSQGTNPRADALNTYCKNKGMSNEIGFYPKGKHCFETFADSIARFERWRENEARGLTDNQALCYYNGAGKVDICPYLSDDYLSMN